MSATNSIRCAVLLLCSFTGPLIAAETFEIKMLNRGPHGAMVYEPEFVKVAPGDSVKFLATSSGHDAVSISGMSPASATPFRGKTNQEITVTLTEPGLYGVKCQPHYAMGMVMLIQVGDTSLSKLSVPDDVPEQAKQRFQDIAARAQAAAL